MLLSLHIKNFVLIDDLNLDFKGGFSAFTGETGAGKSIILTALGLVMGKKASGDFVQHGAASASVAAEFDSNTAIKTILQNNDIDGSELLIRRTITADGKSKAFVNDSPVSLRLLEELGKHLVEIHSQHEQSSLFDSAVQLQMLDDFAKLNLSPLATVFEKLKATAKQLADNKAKIAAAKKEEDYLRHVLGELQDFAPKQGEEQELADKRKAFMDNEKIFGILASAANELTEGKNVESALIAAQKTLLKSGYSQFASVVDSLERAITEVAGVISQLEELSNADNYSEAALENIEARLFEYRGLARKYNTTPDELAAFMAEVEGKLALLKTEENSITALEAELATLQAEYDKLALDASQKRKLAAKKLETKLLAELKPLAMPSTKFEVQFEQGAETAKGFDKITFTASTNPGVPLKPLAGVASGGEISRFMLALKVVLLGVNSSQTIIFDEIDTGTGGAVAAAIGERLARLGKDLQVFVVTHLPQVAATAQNHLLVQKTTSKGKNITSVKALNAKDRQEELARMLAGSNITDAARLAAASLQNSVIAALSGDPDTRSAAGMTRKTK
jgi:DNA repair protein RecN (Recombination protein N)